METWKCGGELVNLEIWRRIGEFRNLEENCEIWGNDKFGNLEEVDEFQEMCLS